jgi:hypothetical protein
MLVLGIVDEAISKFGGTSLSRGERSGVSAVGIGVGMVVVAYF